MRAWPAALLAIAVAGCGPVDPCISESGTCLAIHVQGDVEVDTLSFAIRGGKVSKSFTRALPGVKLPAVVAVLLADTANDMVDVGGDQEAETAGPESRHHRLEAGQIIIIEPQVYWQNWHHRHYAALPRPNTIPKWRYRND